MKKLISLIFLSTLLFAQENKEELLKIAKKYEEKNDFKNAMITYKKLALLKDTRFEKLELNKPEEDFTNIKSKFFEEQIDDIEDEETKETLKQMVVSNFGLYPYKTNYLLPVTYDLKQKDGRDQFETKFQFSIEKPIKYNLLGQKETISFGYTQKSYWQTSMDSAPFRETNYQPEFFVTFPYAKKEKTALKGYKISLLHESNGRNNAQSRSWNRVYLESYFQFSNLFLIPRVWYRLPEKENQDDNPDIDKYLGYGDITLFYPYKKHTFELKLRDNLRLTKENKGAVEFNWTFPMPAFLNIPNTFGYLQLFSGYGENLIDYDQETNKIGLGIAFSR